MYMYMRRIPVCTCAFEPTCISFLRGLLFRSPTL